MAYKVLILDDDDDFNSLLTDIFEQADYIVSSVRDPHMALDLFKAQEYDLVVTDHKMPDMTGAHVMKLLKEIRPEVPVIMVSGYLENNTIRDLISDGVGGVFLKPLNIFSLLERTVELIEEARKVKQSNLRRGGGDVEEDTASGLQIEAEFRSFPCKSQKSIDFAEKLFSLRRFKSTLSLIGEPGSQYRAICEDIRRFDEPKSGSFLYFSPASFDTAQVFSMVESVLTGDVDQVTCVLLGVEKMSEKQKSLAAALAKSEAPFTELEVGVRTVFCVSGDLDDLFDAGLIDESLYILMGTAEVRVPPLRDCPADIAILAQQMVVELTREKDASSAPSFDPSARAFFRKYDWPGNYDELFSIVRQVVDKSRGSALTQSALRAALRVDSGPIDPFAKAQIHLAQLRIDLVRSVLMLCKGDFRKTADFFEVEPGQLKKLLKDG